MLSHSKQTSFLYLPHFWATNVATWNTSVAVELKISTRVRQHGIAQIQKWFARPKQFLSLLSSTGSALLEGMSLWSSDCAREQLGGIPAVTIAVSLLPGQRYLPLRQEAKLLLSYAEVVCMRQEYVCWSGQCWRCSLKPAYTFTAEEQKHIES